MILENSGLLEGLLAQLIKASIFSQVNDAEQIEVEVSMALRQLMQGEASGISIHSKGVWLSPDLEIDGLDIEISRLSISLKDAVQGQLKLDGPLTVSVDVRLGEPSLNQFLNSPPIVDWLGSVVLLERQQAFSLALQRVQCQLQENRLTFELQAELQRRCGNASPLAAAGRIRVAPHRNPYGPRTALIYLEEAHFKPNQTPLIAETAAILSWVGEVIGQRYIEQPHFSATIRALQLSANALELGFDAQIEQPMPLLSHLGL